MGYGGSYCDFLVVTLLVFGDSPDLPGPAGLWSLHIIRWGGAGLLGLSPVDSMHMYCVVCCAAQSSPAWDLLAVDIALLKLASSAEVLLHCSP